MSEANYERHVLDIIPVPDEPFHSLGGPCWCQPTVEEVPPQGRLVIHRRTLDSPRYEAAPPSDFANPAQELGSGKLPRDLADAIAAKRAKP